MKCLVISVLVIICCAVFGWHDQSHADGNSAIATIKNVKGDVQVFRGDLVFPATAGAVLLASDTIVTGEAGAIGVIFKDNSVLSLGPESHLEIDSFQFEPAEEKLSFVANVMHGTLTYLSGLITRLKPESVQFRTPSATIGIRGTHLAIAVEG